MATLSKIKLDGTTYNLAVPYSLTLQGNGTTFTNGVYNGSAAKTVNITASSIGALPLSGGTITGNLAVNGKLTMTGNIAYSNGDYTDYEVIKFHTGDGNGCGVSIGGGGAVVIGAGESASNLISALSLAGSTEQTHITSDSDIYFHTNCQTIANRVTSTLNTAGTLTLGGALYLGANCHLYTKYNGSNFSVVHNHGNGNISINAAGSGLYLGYSNTTEIYCRGNYTNIDSGNYSTYCLPKNPGSIEFFPGSSAGHGGYLDFHYNSSSADYTSRIIESASGKLTINTNNHIQTTGITMPQITLVKNGKTSTIGSQNSGWLHFNTDATSGFYFATNVAVDGDLFAGPNYDEYCIRAKGGALNCNAQYDAGLAYIQAGSNCPSGAQYGILFTMPYRKAYGNTKPDYAGQIFIPDGDDPSYPNSMFFRTSIASSWNSWRRLWKVGDSVTGAVWNDYAECRESDCEEFGYVLMETGDDSLTKTSERLSHFAGVSSDTWGFSQGETEKAKTPIAVAGRVLVYPYRDRNEYKPGDCVCAAPGGTVDIMTREEVIQWPDRIVGTVSSVPNYEIWGGGEESDRPPVEVNNRIWIKVK